MPEGLEPLDQPLTRRAGGTTFGRENDLARLHELIESDGPLVVFLHGIAGVGKSTLLADFVARTRSAGAAALTIDCRLIEPTERGVLSELGRLAGDAVACVEDAVGILEGFDGTVVLALDHYENFQLLDTWLRRVFLPAMPDNVRLVIAGRRPPVSQWLTSPRWHGLVHVAAVDPLDAAAAQALLRSSGVDDGTAVQLAALAHGNPLALKLAASASRAHGAMALPGGAVQEVTQRLTALFLDDVEDPATRDALRSCSVARRITRSLLRAFSCDDEDLFETLRELPFVDLQPDGLRIHDAVREAMARSLKASDPERYHAARRRVWRQLHREIRLVPSTDFWRYTADMLYLIENPVVREAFFPSGRRQFAVEAARAADREAVRGIARRHDGSEASAPLDAWWESRPDAFRVIRDPDDRVVGFYCMSEARDLPEAVRRLDPVTEAWCRHLEKEPVSRSGKCLYLRRWLSLEKGESQSPEQAACWLDVKRTYMELRPALRRVYIALADLAPYADVSTKLCFRPIEDATVSIAGTRYSTAMLDFGPASVDGWISGLVAAELGVSSAGLLDRERRALTLDGEEVPLTPLEFGLIEFLESLDGATATRDAILDAVWGQDDASGSSNVVDAVVKSLRRKLGAEAGRVETVRGFGYRWRRD